MQNTQNPWRLLKSFHYSELSNLFSKGLERLDNDQKFRFMKLAKGVVIQSRSRIPVSMGLDSALHMQSVMDSGNHIYYCIVHLVAEGAMWSCRCASWSIWSIHETLGKYESRSLQPTLLSSILRLRIILSVCIHVLIPTKSSGVQPLNVRDRVKTFASY